MKNNKSILWITQTALLSALLVGWQALSVQFSTLVTGSGVNFILAVGAMLFSMSTGLTLSMISPLMAALIGIAPNWVLVPFIMTGNAVYVLMWHVIGKRKPETIFRLTALLAAAGAKFGVLYLGIIHVAVPFITDNFKEPLSVAMPERLIGLFGGFHQLITALAGGALAFITIPALNKALSSVRK
jgi:hypothetical protein